MATKAERAFAEHVRAIEKQWLNDRRAALRRAQDIVRDYGNEVAAAIAKGGHTEWRMAHLQEQERALRAAADRLEARLQVEWEMNAETAAARALAGVDGALRTAIGKDVDTPHFVSEREAFLVAEYVPSLIKNVSDDVHKAVQKQLQAAVTGGRSGSEIMREVAREVGSRKRAQVVMRTEMNRLHNMTRENRIKEISASQPGLGSMWLHRPSPNPRPAHQALHGKVIYPAKNELFNVNGYRVPGPHDSGLPAEEVINCHCSLVAHFDASQQPAQAADVPLEPALLNPRAGAAPGQPGTAGALSGPSGGDPGSAMLQAGASAGAELMSRVEPHDTTTILHGTEDLHDERAQPREPRVSGRPPIPPPAPDQPVQPPTPDSPPDPPSDNSAEPGRNIDT